MTKRTWTPTVIEGGRKGPSLKDSYEPHAGPGGVLDNFGMSGVRVDDATGELIISGDQFLFREDFKIN